jgi:nucleotide-binding universal stress UspA family protein
MNGISTIALERILLPTDFSDVSRQAFPQAVALARQFGASLTLVYVLPTAWPAELSHFGVVLEEKRLGPRGRKDIGEIPYPAPASGHHG